MASFLFVDADPMLLTALRRLTRELSGTRRFVQSAEEALALIQAEEPTALVCGYRLPGLDGLALLEQVRERYPRVALALHTATPPAHFRRDGRIFLLEKLSPPEELLRFLGVLGAH